MSVTTKMGPALISSSAQGPARDPHNQEHDATTRRQAIPAKQRIRQHLDPFLFVQVITPNVDCSDSLSDQIYLQKIYVIIYQKSNHSSKELTCPISPFSTAPVSPSQPAP